MPKVSVVIPTYNMARFLSEAIESVLRQSFRDFEVIVIDDGSTDNTPELAQSFPLPVRYFRQENGGVSAARNRGIELALGEYIRFVDADDMVTASGLEQQVALLDGHPRVGLVYGQAYQVDERGKFTLLRRPRFARGSYVRSGREEIKDLLFWVHITLSTVMVRRECFEEVGCFRNAYSGEDWMMWLRIAKKYDVAYIAEPLAKYRKHMESLSLNVKLEQLAAQREAILALVYGDRALAALYMTLRKRAYFNMHYLLAGYAYTGGRMAFVRARLREAFRADTAALAAPRGLAAAYVYLKSFLQSPVRSGLRRARRGLMRALGARRPQVPSARLEGPGEAGG